MINKLNDASALSVALRDFPLSECMARTPLVELVSRLNSYVTRRDHHVFAVHDNDVLTGIFAFLILPDERYIELLEPLTENVSAACEMLEFIRSRYSGFNLDCVFNPENSAVSAALSDIGADFEPMQVSLRCSTTIAYNSNLDVQPLSEKYHDEYMSIHAKDCYWTAERVIASRGAFNVLIALEHEKVVGYIDFTVNADESEIFDLFVDSSVRSCRYEQALISYAVRCVAPKSVFVVVDENDTDMLSIYQSLGFDTVENGRMVTASTVL